MERFKGNKLPWHVDSANYRDYGIIDADGNEVMIMPAQCSVDDHNARLIDSIGDLISSLKHLVEVYDSEDGKQWTTSSKKEAIAKARAAIDKALGE